MRRRCARPKLAGKWTTLFLLPFDVRTSKRQVSLVRKSDVLATVTEETNCPATYVVVPRTPTTQFAPRGKKNHPPSNGEYENFISKGKLMECGAARGSVRRRQINREHSCNLFSVSDAVCRHTCCRQASPSRHQSGVMVSLARHLQSSSTTPHHPPTQAGTALPSAESIAVISSEIYNPATPPTTTSAATTTHRV